MNKDISILVLSHKSKNLVTNLIKKLYNKFPIIVVDNSDDLELKRILNEEYSRVIYHSIDNNGYGAAINFGSNFIKTKYFLILNPDIEDINEKKIIYFEKAASKLNDKFSVLGPRYTNLDIKSIKQSNENIEIANWKFISGACMFIKNETFKLLSGFDENFFLYFEESDYCLRAYKINKNYQINNIKIKHNAGTSVNTKSVAEKEKLNNLYNWHFVWSKFYYFKKHYGFLISMLYFLPILFRTNIKIIYFRILSDYKKMRKYKIRNDALLSSIKGEKSYKRINNF